MRARGSEITPAERPVPVAFDGRALAARRGETIAAALAANGIAAFRATASGAPRGLFCGMGVCRDCVVEIDGHTVRRACMTKIDAALDVRQNRQLATLEATGGRPVDHASADRAPLEPDLVVVGAGAGGLSAASVAAEAGLHVVLVDDRPAPGGQYFKQFIDFPGLSSTAHRDAQFDAGRDLIERAKRAETEVITGGVWSASRPLEIRVAGAAGSRVIRPRQLIVATGAYERALPVPGWTLPGVMTTGAAQTLLRSYRVLPGRRIVVAGNGPLNLQVAGELSKAGADVLCVAELAGRPAIHSAAALWAMVRNAPGLVRRGLRYRRDLARARIPVLYGHALSRVDKSADGLRASISAYLPRQHGPVAEFDGDAVLMGYGFLPSNEISRLLGCRHDYDRSRGQLVTRRDADCRTSVAGVFAVGDCCGLGGAQAAMAEGIIAGVAAIEAAGGAVTAAAARERKAARRSLARQRRFQSALWTLFAAPRPDIQLADAETIVCRCEEVTLGDVEAQIGAGRPSMSEIKRGTRLGMGPCQGRYCTPLVAALLHDRFGVPLDEYAYFAPRPPIQPVAIDEVIR
ncbi:MAG: FAD-dependent oxidoreductase [Alphaproteobacteria bacterium]|nr:FAD-dependent oxidoreductase [Alphaproteobacteria bacterium]